MLIVFFIVILTFLNRNFFKFYFMNEISITNLIYDFF